MIQKIIIRKITHIITIKFIICSFLRKLKIEIAAGFIKMYLPSMFTTPAVRFAGKILCAILHKESIEKDISNAAQYFMQFNFLL